MAVIEVSDAVSPTGVASPAVTTRYTETLSGDLGAQIDGAGATTVSLANPHGDTVTTVTIPAGASPTANAVSIGPWADYTEHGQTTPEAAAAATTVGGTIGYGWLGAKQRSTTDDTAGLTLMGVRLYNNNRGLFTATDPVPVPVPVPGGSSSAYAYPNDPINQYDLDGNCWTWICDNPVTKAVSTGWNKTTSSGAWNSVASFGRRHTRSLSRAGRVFGWISTAASYCPLIYCTAVSLGAGTLSAGAYAWAGKKNKASAAMMGVGYSLITGGRGSWVRNASRLARVVNGRGSISGMYARSLGRRHRWSHSKIRGREYFASTIFAHSYNMGFTF